MRLEQQLEEQAARLKAEENAKLAQMRSDDEIQKLSVKSRSLGGLSASKCNSATPLIPVPPKSLIFLHEWWLVKQCKGLAIGGVASVERDRERVFLSTVIAEREEANVLHSEDGITILFRGFINTSRSSQNGVPLEVCQHFLVGFPHDWKKYSAHSFGDEDDGDGVTSFGYSSASSKKRDDDALPFSISDNDFTKRQDSIFDSNTYTCPYGKSTVKPPTSTNKMKRKQFSGDRKEKQWMRQKTVSDAGNSCNRMVTRSISKKSHTVLKEYEKATITSAVSPVRRSARLHSRR